MILENPPRDVKIDRTANDKFEFLARRFGIDKKDVFILAMKVGFYYGVSKKLGKTQSLFQFSTLDEGEIKNMIIIAHSVLNDISQIFNGKDVVKICEEFAHGGVYYLYETFSAIKEDSRIIETIIEELRKKI